MKKMLFFVNPKAGNGEVRDSLMDILQEFSLADYQIVIHPTRNPGDLTDVLAREGQNYDMVVATGGDGTLNETTAGLMELPPESRPVVGYIPGGTCNDVAATLGLSRVAKKAARDIVTGSPYTMDVGQFNDRWFNYVAAFGAFTDVSYRTRQEEKRLLGRLAYLLDGAKGLGDIRPTEVELTIDGETRRERVLVGMVTSTTSVGGFNMKNKEGVALDDGLFEVLLLREIRTPKELSDAARGLLKGDFSSKEFFFCKTDRLELRFPEPTDWTLDGEYGGTVDHAVIQNIPRQISIITPAEK